MDSSIASAFSDDELLQEALAVLDGVDIEDLDVLTTLVAEEPADTSDHSDSMLKVIVNANPSSTLKGPGAEIQRPYQTHGNLRGNNVFHTLSRKMTATGRGQGRIRLREQIIQLRSVVRQMETHLETLKSPTSPRFNTHAVKNEVGIIGAKSDEPNGADEQTAAWRAIAMQQFYDRRKAEQQNALLRENLTTQIRLAKQLKALLHPVSCFLSTSSYHFLLDRTHFDVSRREKLAGRRPALNNPIKCH
ncbi:unnamed protein product [Phytophthora fragariaefolia]|uniref:Unnamed protein product n=1 Tax=Phytophthora fragariaefolia TaxID=1490495 RepID=A0A9W6XIN7_9STRA|nr:unnamed protein product [Phytophthora fragariaefolia]